jgi:hypothetical protein
MTLVRQYVEVEGNTDHLTQWVRLISRHAMQIQDINGIELCRIFWEAQTPADAIISDPRRTRGIYIIKGSSAAGPGDVAHIPALGTLLNCHAELLDEWEGHAPANFGGDIYHWWKAYYIIPDYWDEDVGPGPEWSMQVDASGSFKSINWYLCNEPLNNTGTGTFGDGVDLEFQRDTFYGGSGSLVNPTDVTLTSQTGDVVQLFSEMLTRDFDNLAYNLTFEHSHHSFSKSQLYINRSPDTILTMLFDPQDDNENHIITLQGVLTISPVSLPGSARGRNTQLSTRLRGICMPDA